MPFWKSEPWDSSILGVGVARITDFSQIATTEAQCREGHVKYLFGKIPVDSPGLLSTLQTQGFQVICADMELLFDGYEYPKARAVTVKAKKSDEPCLVDLASRSFTLDRFHADPTIPPVIANESRRSWVRNAFHDGKGIWTTPDLLSLIIYHAGRIELVCVDESMRNRDTGRALCIRVLSEYRRLFRWGHLATTTQISNIPALRMYLSVGFKPVTSHLVVRKWLNG